MCTIANTPRLPEHCIAYAFEVMWEREFALKKVFLFYLFVKLKFDGDSYEDLNWVYERALERSN